jgi:hypothetical protein
MFDDDVASGLLNDEDSITGPTLAKLFFDDTSTEEEGWLFPKQRAQLLEACGIKTNES